MKLFLCSHFSSVGSLIKEEIENKKVAFIPTASLREGYTGYVGSARKLFKKLGAIVTEIDISTEAYSTIQSVFEDADVLGYLLLYGYDVSGRAFALRVIGLTAGMLVCMAVFYKNQKNRPYRRTFKDLFREFDVRSARNQWYLKLTLIVSSAMLIVSLLGLPRAMWAGIACMSVCLPFTEDGKMRAVDRGVFNMVGCALFLILYLILPESGRSMIGIIGGIGVGYSAGYKWQTVFNTFGALAIAASLFGLPMALLLRTGINVTASLYTVVCNVVYDKLHGKRAEIAENLVKP